MIDEGYRYCGRFLFDLNTNRSRTGFGFICIVCDVYEKLFHGNIYLRVDLDGTFKLFDLFINKLKDLIEIFN